MKELAEIDGVEQAGLNHLSLGAIVRHLDVVPILEQRLPAGGKTEGQGGAEALGIGTIVLVHVVDIRGPAPVAVVI